MNVPLWRSYKAVATPELAPKFALIVVAAFVVVLVLNRLSAIATKVNVATTARRMRATNSA